MSEGTAPEELVGFDDSGNAITSSEQSVDKAAPGSEEVSGEPAKEPATFMDPEKVAPGEEGAYKSMQGAFTRSMQDLSEQKKGIDEFRQKAAALDGLMAHQGFRKVVEAVKDGSLNADNLLSAPAPEGADELEPDMKAYVDKRLSEIEQNAQSSQAQVRAQMEAKEFVAANPDWKTYEQGMSKIWNQYPGMAMQDCYKLARYDVVTQANDRASKKLSTLQGEQRTALVTDPGQVSRGAEADAPVQSVTEAARRALQELRGKGMKFPV